MRSGSVRAEAERLLRAVAGDGAVFRPGQWEAIEEIVVHRRRALVVQRTGWGKSAVYLIGTRLLRDAGRGPTLIVSPLLALMRNQMEMAHRAGVTAATINSTNREVWADVTHRVEAGELDLLLISPERLNNAQFLADTFPLLLRHMGLLVVDEVHCISDWGHDFRPDYRRLGRIVRALPPGIPVLGTTATANGRVVDDVVAQLGVDLVVHRGSLDRESLALQVLRMGNRADRLAWLAGTVPRLSGAGIVYCLTVKDARRVGEWLRRRGVAAAVYTGGTDPDRRLGVEESLRRGDLKVVVATSALGMGYDNPHIEFVVHYQSPGSAIAYYQQVGRAGRAVDRAYGILMAGAEDRDIQDFFIETAFPDETTTTTLLGALAAAGDEGRSVFQLEEEVNLGRGRLVGALKILEVEGAVYREGTRWFRSAQRWRYPTERVQSVTAARRAEQAAMLEYVQTDGCLMEFLRRQLDDPEASPCGRCANCRGAPVVDPSVDPRLRDDALGYLDRTYLPIEPRRRWPPGVELPLLREFGCAEGRCLSLWGDPGWAERVRKGKYELGRFGDELVEAAASMIEDWSPRPPPTWVTAVPGKPVEDFASRLAVRLGLPFVPAVRRRVRRRPQKTMKNGTQQFRNVEGAFEVAESRAGPVLLIDDMVDSRWTFTMVGFLLRRAGVEAVYPVALADTSRSGG